jgi:hypothetical protein
MKAEPRNNDTAVMDRIMIDQVVNGSTRVPQEAPSNG